LFSAFLSVIERKRKVASNRVVIGLSLIIQYNYFLRGNTIILEEFSPYISLKRRNIPVFLLYLAKKHDSRQ
jgi:hypothetical protein